MVLNNIGCCKFSEGNHKQAWVTFLEAREIQHKTAQADLDLLHVAITLSNLGYVLIQMRQYEQAQEVFEEALLVSYVFCCLLEPWKRLT
jgi:Tfp pilus assembly protein PilF